MNQEEVEAVLGHELSHVANGDMVTLTLIQGVVNTFVIFLSRIVGSIVDRTVFRTERGTGPGYFITVIVCQIVFGILASMIVAWFSRWREFRADAGSARLLGAAADDPRAARGSAGSRPASCRRRCRRSASPAAAAAHGALRVASADRGAHRRAAVHAAR